MRKDRLFILARHGQSKLNVERVVNGNPSRPGPLTTRGERQARLLGAQLRNLPIELCLHTRFARTRQTAELALAGRDVSMEVEPLLDEVDVGALDGHRIDEYRRWKRDHRRADHFPDGESLNEAAGRYAQAFRALTARPERSILVICHEISIRYALSAAAHANDLDRPYHVVPNATPYLFGADVLIAAANRLELLAEPPEAMPAVEAIAREAA